jgi:hypothetical protein
MNIQTECVFCCKFVRTDILLFLEIVPFGFFIKAGFFYRFLNKLFVEKQLICFHYNMHMLGFLPWTSSVTDQCLVMQDMLL